MKKIKFIPLPPPATKQVEEFLKRVLMEMENLLGIPNDMAHDPKKKKKLPGIFQKLLGEKKISFVGEIKLGEFIPSEEFAAQAISFLFGQCPGLNVEAACKFDNPIDCFDYVTGLEFDPLKMAGRFRLNLITGRFYRA